VIDHFCSDFTLIGRLFKWDGFVDVERGLGIFYWDATRTAVPCNGWDPADAISGNSWENQALFDYENRALPAMNLFNSP